MKACVRADLYRLYSCKARVIFSIIIMLISMGMMFLVKSMLMNQLGYFEAGIVLTNGVGTFPIVMPIIIGIFEISQVFGVDFKAQTIQAAVGIGKKRLEILLAKQLESYICIFTDVLCGYIGVLIFCLIHRIAVTESYSLSIISVFISIWFTSAVYITAASVLAYLRLGVGLATVIYVFFCFGLNSLFTVIGNSLGISKDLLNTIVRFTVTEQRAVLTNRIQAKSLLFSNIAFFVLSIIAWNVLAYLVIRKKEFDL